MVRGKTALHREGSRLDRNFGVQASGSDAGGEFSAKQARVDARRESPFGDPPRHATQFSDSVTEPEN